MRIRIEATYDTSTSTEVELPEGKTWDDVQDFWIKWGTLHLRFEDGTKIERDMDEDTEVDWKWPSHTLVLQEDGDDWNYSEPLSQEDR